MYLDHDPVESVFRVCLNFENIKTEEKLNSSSRILMAHFECSLHKVDRVNA
jgi:hypothetical protein